MKNFQKSTFPFVLTVLLALMINVNDALAQESKKEINMTGIWERDDGKTRTIEHVEGGIIMTTEGERYFYKKIGLNKYQMEWTVSQYGGKYRWTLHVVNDTQFKNYYENLNYKSRTPKIYMRMVI